MKDFSKLIVAAGLNFHPEFLFHPVVLMSANRRYHISVRDRQGVSIGFNMDEKMGSWKIVNAPKVPDWIMQLEDQLCEAIQQSIAA